MSPSPTVYAVSPSAGLPRPLYAARVPAGFPSPADDHLEGKLDIARYLVRHPAATYFVRVVGESMLGAGIHDGDLLVVDSSLDPADGQVVVAVVNGEMAVKRVRKNGNRLLLVSENERYPPIEVVEGDDFNVWGVVTMVLHKP